MKITSLNVNGLRAAVTKGFYEWLAKNDFDVICLQEVKATEDQLDLKTITDLGYHFYFNPAQKKGYSGVGILTKIKPDIVVIGMDNPIYDVEGRIIRADFGELSVMSAYIPSGTSGDERQDFKMRFLKDFNEYILNLKKSREHLIISGDYNICHKPIDINNPKKHLKSSGFLPEEREWFDKFVDSGMVDTFRVFNQEPEQYSWWSYRANAKAKNLGWRIDYHLVTESLKNRLTGASIMPDVSFSDHCPVCVNFDL